MRDIPPQWDTGIVAPRAFRYSSDFMPTLYLIDGYGQFFRAYHAIRTPMTSPVTKERRNMTFGFIGMLLKLLRGEGKHMAAAGGKPDYVAVARDVSGDRGTFRSQIYPEYKATRSEMPEAMPPQIDRCMALLKDIGVPLIGSEGFEARRCVATLATRLREQHPDLTIPHCRQRQGHEAAPLRKGPANAAASRCLMSIPNLLITENSFKADTA
jgi:5'-3' exonuclease